MAFQDQEAGSPRSLTEEKTGFQGVIKGLSGQFEIIERLQELGFVAGESVVLHSRTPFRDPVIVDIRGTLIALRQEEATCIQI